MKKGIMLLALFSLHCLLFTVKAQIQWQKCFGGTNQDEATCIQQTTDGGYIVAGSSDSNDGDVSGNHGSEDCWIVKSDATGTIQWQKSYGGTGTDKANAIQQTSDGGYIIAGITVSNDGDVNGNHDITGTYADCWVVKINASGILQWQKCFGGTLDDGAFSVQQTSDGGYIVAGGTNSNDGNVSGLHGSTYYDFWVLKLDGSGNLVWQKCLGGTDNELAYSVQQTTDGGYIVSGVTSSNNGNVSGNHGISDYWLVKLNSGGTLQWQKCFGGTSDEGASFVQQTSDGGYILAGNSYSNNGNVSGNHGNYDCWVVKVNSTGTLQWQKCLGGTDDDEATSVLQTTDGGYAVAGFANSNDGDVSGIHGSADYWIVKLSTTGVLQWQKCLGGSDYETANYMMQTSDGGFILTGHSLSNNGDVSGIHGFSEDYWVVKLGAATDIEESTEENTFTIYPNPATSSLTIQTTNNQQLKTIHIYNVLGESIINSTITNHQSPITVDVSTLPAGIYFLEANFFPSQVEMSANGSPVRKKFIKQ